MSCEGSQCPRPPAARSDTTNYNLPILAISTVASHLEHCTTAVSASKINSSAQISKNSHVINSINSIRDMSHSSCLSLSSSDQSLVNTIEFVSSAHDSSTDNLTSTSNMSGSATPSASTPALTGSATITLDGNIVAQLSTLIGTQGLDCSVQVSAYFNILSVLKSAAYYENFTIY